ncbi:MAG: sulfatase [Tenuifilaceae bacterium]
MKKIVPNNSLNLALLGLACMPAMAQKSEVKQKPNVLFIAVDDLKPILGCYGDKLVKTPNIDRLASRGSVFLNTYCQQAVSGPTRASLLTGMRPDYTQVWDLRTPMRDVMPDILALPQYYVSQGYETSGIGKIYHPGNIDKQQDKVSWSIPYLEADEYYAKEYGSPALRHWQSPTTKNLIEKYRKEATDQGLKGAKVNDYITKYIKPSVECIDVPDNAYEDGAIALNAKDQIVKLSKGDKSFFMAVGFHKPHLPFVSPKKYWDLYNREDMPLAKFQEHAKNSPEIAYTRAGELKNYSDIPALCTYTDQTLGTGLAVEKQKELIHGYYAAISFTDAQIGILLNTLDSLGIADNTIIILWGDHGWHLGDHDLWCKHTNFENATHVPLIISAPGFKPNKTESISEFVDIFPTLCDLSGIPVPTHLDGKSLVPVMKNPKSKVKDFAVSQYPRSLKAAEAKKLGLESRDLMGYSIRNNKYRYTVWMNNKYRSNEPFDASRIYASELYDYEKDALETVNVVDEKEYKSVKKKMNKKMKSFLKSQLKIGQYKSQLNDRKSDKTEGSDD